MKHIINCDKDPKIPYDSWKIESHKKVGLLDWDKEKIELYISEKQKNGSIAGSELLQELNDKPVLNACVLDYLLENPQLIPEECKKDKQERTRYIFFWGTIYRGSDGRLCVRGLYWSDGVWLWRCRWLDGEFDVQCPAALRASITLPSHTKTLSTPALKSLELRVSKLEKTIKDIKKLL